MNLKLLRPLLLLLVTAAVAAGCAEERPPINRVQPNALDKAFFVGDLLQDPKDDPEFWTQATIIDVGYGAPGFGLFTSTFTQGVARIKWEITEDKLLGRLTYERIENSDGKGAGPASTDGQVVAAYTIRKHFDIRHAYNPSTGVLLISGMNNIGGLFSEPMQIYERHDDHFHMMYANIRWDLFPE